MDKTLFTKEYIEKQEGLVKAQTEEFFGKGRNGFCDFGLDGVEFLLHAFQLWEPDQLTAEKKHKNFKSGLRFNAYYHFYRVSFSFKATYNLIITGYYTEASIILRSIVETFVKLRFVELSENEEYLMTSIAGHYGFEGKKFTIKYEEQFEKVAPGLYTHYRLLCDMSHGAIASLLLKSEEGQLGLKLDNGVLFNSMNSSFAINQFVVYMLAHIEYLMHLFPEVKRNMPPAIAAKYHKTLSTLRKLMDDFSQMEKNKLWYEAVKKLTIFS